MSTISNNNYFYSLSTIRSALERAISSVSDNISCYCCQSQENLTIPSQVKNANFGQKKKANTSYEFQ